MALGEYLGAGSGVTKNLCHLNGNSNDSSGNWYNRSSTNVTWVAWHNSTQSANYSNWSSASYSWITQDALFATTTWTMAFWMKVSATTIDWSLRFAYFCESGSWRWVDATFNTYSTVKVFTVNYYTGSTYWNPSPETSIPVTKFTVGKWHHIAITMNWAVMALYLDWSLYVQWTGVWNFWTPNWNVQQDIWGDHRYTNRNSYASFDEFIIENKTWSADQVRRYVTFSSGRFWII